MERRRGVSKRPASTEEIECWSQATSYISALSSSSTQETVDRVNQLIASLPADDAFPADGFGGVRSNYKKLASGLEDIKTQSDREKKAIDEALEKLSVLIALRQASESSTPQDKQRPKRPRAHSPLSSSTTPTPALVASGRNASTPTQRGSAGPQPSTPTLRGTKIRGDTLRDTLLKQLPLREGRMVAFHPPSSGKGADGTSPEDMTWIMAKIVKYFHPDKYRYEVEDIEPQEDGKPLRYQALLRSAHTSIIPLPDKDASVGSPAHMSAYQEFPTGATVLALYPDTSCFYRAEVVASPKDIPTQGRNSGTYYKLKFEDDDDQEHMVSAAEVVEWPGQ